MRTTRRFAVSWPAHGETPIQKAYHRPFPLGGSQLVSFHEPSPILPTGTLLYLTGSDPLIIPLRNST
jgi:hypothetical protein